MGIRSVQTAVLAALLLWASGLQAAGGDIDFVWEGRLTKASGEPYSGTVSLSLAFYHSPDDPSPVASYSQGLENVPLDEGVFQIRLPIPAAQYHRIFPDIGQTVFVQLTDLTHADAAPFPRQRLSVIPYAGKVPVDGVTLEFDSSGRLKVISVPQDSVLGLAAALTRKVEMGESSLELPPYGTATGATRALRFRELGNNGNEFVGLKAPDSVASSFTWVLPATEGLAGQVLGTDGSGALQWVAAPESVGTAGGDLSGLFPNPSVTRVGGASGKSAADIVAGINAVQAASPANTPLALVQRDMNGGFSAGSVTVSASNPANQALIVRGATGQSSHLQEWRDGSDNVLGAIDSNGGLRLKGGPTTSATLRANPSTASNVTYTLPASLAAGQFLTTDANGQLAWAPTPADLVTSVAGMTGSVVLSTSHITGLRSLATADAVSGGTGGTIIDDSITNADLNSAAAIADSKLATVTTAGKVANSATTATSANTGGTIVARDSSGNFSAGTITATLSGTASNVSGTVAISNGGTGATTKTGAFDSLSPMTAVGDLIYGGTSGSGTRLPGNASLTKMFLSSQGITGGTQAPGWSALAPSDIPPLSASQITSGTLSNALINWAAPGAIGSTTAGIGAFTTLTTTGNVGIGTTNPTTRLDIYGDIRSSADDSYLAIDGGWDRVGFTKKFGSTGMLTYATGEKFAISQSSGATIAPSNTFIQRMVVDANGLVGIGTSTPTNKLQVAGDIGAIGQYERGTYLIPYLSDSWVSGLGTNLSFDGSNWKAKNDGANNGASAILTNFVGTMSFYTVPTNGNIVQTLSHYDLDSIYRRMVIKEDGRIGIGTAEPSTHLTIASGELGIGLVAGDFAYLRMGMDSSFNQYLANNAYWTGTDYNYVNPGGYGGVASLIRQGSGNIDFLTASGGADPITWSNRMTITNGGNVGIGTNSPTQKLHVVGRLLVQGTSTCTLGSATGTVSCSSDMRLKDHIRPISHILEKISLLRGVEFDWNERSQASGTHAIGVIAQDVEAVFPTAVITDDSTGYKMVDYPVLVAPLIEGVKALHAENLKLRDENDAVKVELFELKAESQSIKAKAQATEDRLNRLLDVLCKAEGRAEYCE